jgi:cysteine desulfurase/selenocysteine lyase
MTSRSESNLRPEPSQDELPPFDVLRVRADFPILQSSAHGHPLVYLDNGATTQKPRMVIEAQNRFYRSQNANIHRGVYQLSQVATDAYENARKAVAAFINAASEREVVFTRGTTEAINLVAASWGRANLRAGEEILLSQLEHHSNIVPWQLVAAQTGAIIKVIPTIDSGEIDYAAFERLLSPRTRMVAVTHLSNSLGTIVDVRRITSLAHAVGAKVLIDGAQWVAHFPTDVQHIGCDFYAFSGHKLFGPTGIGVLWGRELILDSMPPYQGGGDMIETVSFEQTTYAGLPAKFEAGTPNIAGAVGLHAAIDYINSIGFDRFRAHEEDVYRYALDQLRSIKGLRVLGPDEFAQRASVISFVIDRPPISSLDIGNELDRRGIAIRTGHHCCMPLMKRLGISGTARASFSLYNTRGEVDRLVAALCEIIDERSTRPAAAPAPEVPADLAELKFPDAVAPSPRAAADELVETFEMLGDWDDRYRYVIELGEKLLPLPNALKTEANRVKGCQSIVHLVARRKPATKDIVQFLADSDADIVRGLIAILQRVFSGQHARDVLKFDVETFFRKLGLDQHLSTGRRNGLEGMVKRIRAAAQSILDENANSSPAPAVQESPPEPGPQPAPPQPKAASPASSIQKKLLEGKIIEALRTVYDPEVPVNIYELGLIYGIDINDDNEVSIRMTLTAPACPVAGTLPGEVEKKVESIDEVKSAKVELVWDPPWSRDMMSEEALLQLGMI